MPRFMGPLTILDTVGPNAVKLDLPASLAIHPTVSVSLIKPFKARATSALPPVNIRGVEEYELESIVDHNVLSSKKKNGLNLVEFLVRWKGGYEDSWNLFEDFENSMDTLEMYLQSRCTKTMRCSIYKVLKPGELQRLSRHLQKEASEKVK